MLLVLSGLFTRNLTSLPLLLSGKPSSLIPSSQRRAITTYPRRAMAKSLPVIFVFSQLSNKTR